MKDFLVAFDLDGTLLNTDHLIFESFKYVFSKYFPDYNLSKDELLSFLGPSLVDSFSRYVSGDMVNELVDCYREYNESHHQEYVTIYPHVRETLEYLSAKGYPLVVITTKYRKAAYIGLDMFDISQYFVDVIGGDDVVNGKPDPESIYQALLKTKCLKGVMIGDNKSDIMTGKNANIYTIGVKWTPKGYQDIEVLQPDLMIDDMSEIINFIEEVSK